MTTAPSGAAERQGAGAPPPDEAAHLLVIDDDARLRSLLARYLGDNGFRVTAAADAAEARRTLEGLAFDLLVIDVMMPGENGIELTKSLRAGSDIPILILTARSESESRILGLEAGADDYLPKPFEPRELLLRINAILRRGARPEAAASPDVRFGPFTFNLARGELSRGGEQIRLTDRERELLAAFAARPGETIARADLAGEDGGLGERTIDVQINRLRRKIEPDSANPIYLQTVRGIGYRLATD
ncbi:MAG TPA: response regulator [Kaistiaceae bacterium]|nr:response regulator [Kaistiaceae bacterium]